MRFLVMPILIVPLLLMGCGEEPTIQRYEVTQPVSFHWPDAPLREANHEVDGMAWVWEVPAGWIDAPEVSERLIADYRFKGSNQTMPGRVTVSKIDGEGGGVNANVMRWLGQIYITTPQGLGPDDRADSFPIGKNTLTFVDLHGQYQGEHMPTRIYAIIYQIASVDGGVFQTWFFKMAGDDETIEKGRAGLAQMALTLRPEGEPRPTLPRLDDAQTSEPEPQEPTDQP